MLIELGEMYGGDYFYFLFEGLVGIVCFFFDLIKLEMVRFFVYEF